MTGRPVLPAIALLSLFLAACAPLQQPPAEAPEPAPPAPVEEVDEPREPPPDQVEEEPAPTSSAVTSLVNRGWSAYRTSDYQTALGYAERAQRIDPRSPEVYLLMARAQLGLLQRDVAEQVVGQGLAMARSGTAIYGQLQAVLNEIAGAASP